VRSLLPKVGQRKGKKGGKATTHKYKKRLSQWNKKGGRPKNDQRPI
jgi:hypothetical protein